MAIQTINLGNYANDGTGDDLRAAFEKVNANFTLLDSRDVTSAANLVADNSTTKGVFAQKSGTTFQFKSLRAGSNISLTSDGTSVTINGSGNLQSETTPTLGGNLNLNGNNILGAGYGVGYTGDIKSTVWGIDIRTLPGANGNLDFGTITSPGPSGIDFGTF